MTKQEYKHSEISQESNNIHKNVTKSQFEVDHKQKMRSPILSDNVRVVFSEELNRDSEMDDG